MYDSKGKTTNEQKLNPRQSGPSVVHTVAHSCGMQYSTEKS